MPVSKYSNNDNHHALLDIVFLLSVLHAEILLILDITGGGVEPISTTTKERSFLFSSVIHGMQGFARLRFTQPEFGPDFPSGACLFIPLTFRLSLCMSVKSTIRRAGTTTVYLLGS